MEIEIFWTDFAKAKLKQIFSYYSKKASPKIARKIIHNIIKKTKYLSIFPESGKIEELLAKRPQNFRFIIATNYKIIYWVNKNANRIEIVDVFDTRQNPIKIENIEIK